MSQSVRIQLRKATETEWATANPTLLIGEIGIDVTHYRAKTGDGFSSWLELPYLDEAGIDDLSAKYGDEVDFLNQLNGTSQNEPVTILGKAGKETGARLADLLNQIQGIDLTQLAGDVSVEGSFNADHIDCKSLIVRGETKLINSQVVEIGDDLLELNKAEDGTKTSEVSGIQIYQGNYTQKESTDLLSLSQNTEGVTLLKLDSYDTITPENEIPLVQGILVAYNAEDILVNFAKLEGSADFVDLDTNTKYSTEYYADYNGVSLYIKTRFSETQTSDIENNATYLGDATELYYRGLEIEGKRDGERVLLGTFLNVDYVIVENEKPKFVWDAQTQNWQLNLAGNLSNLLAIFDAQDGSNLLIDAEPIGNYEQFSTELQRAYEQIDSTPVSLLGKCGKIAGDYLRGQVADGDFVTKPEMGTMQEFNEVFQELASPDADGDGVPDINDAFPLDPTEWADTDSDGVGDNADAFPNDPSETKDTDSDGVGDNKDAFPSDPSEWLDTDNDGVGDNADAFPRDATQQTDRDGDGCGDNLDGNHPDLYPDDPTECKDSDGDGIPDGQDDTPNEFSDADGDGVSDFHDAFPEDPTEWVDTDDDGTGDNSDAFKLDPTQQTDTDGDGYGDNPEGTNPDDFPEDPTEWRDTDGDGTGDNTDAFVDDASQTTDSDGDGYGDNPLGKNPDAFPEDPTEWVDSDGDGVGDNSQERGDWILVPAGEGVIGHQDSTSTSYTHDVRFRTTNEFYAMSTPVTNKLVTAVLTSQEIYDASVISKYNPDNPYYWKPANTPDHSALGMGDSLIVAFINKFNQIARNEGTLDNGWQIDLIDVFQHEWISRAGTNTKYWWGDNYDETKANLGSTPYLEAKAYPPNQWGFYDVVGGVPEYTRTNRDDMYEGNYGWLTSKRDETGKTTKTTDLVVKSGKNVISWFGISSMKRSGGSENIRLAKNRIHGNRMELITNPSEGVYQLPNIEENHLVTKAQILDLPRFQWDTPFEINSVNHCFSIGMKFKLSGENNNDLIDRYGRYYDESKYQIFGSIGEDFNGFQRGKFATYITITDNVATLTHDTLNSTYNITQSAVIPDPNNWQSLMLVCEPNPNPDRPEVYSYLLKYYLNGESLMTINTYNRNYVPSTNFSLGHSYFQGREVFYYADVAYYDRPLTSEEVTQTYQGRHENPKALYPLDGGEENVIFRTINKVYDATGNYDILHEAESVDDISQNYYMGLPRIHNARSNTDFHTAFDSDNDAIIDEEDYFRLAGTYRQTYDDLQYYVVDETTPLQLGDIIRFNTPKTDSLGNYISYPVYARVTDMIYGNTTWRRATTREGGTLDVNLNYRGTDPLTSDGEARPEMVWDLIVPPQNNVDTDGDGYLDTEDAFANDPTEWADSDKDLVGDNSDAFPNDPTETADTDEDGVGDNADAFETIASEQFDSDNDAVGDNADSLPLSADNFSVHLHNLSDLRSHNSGELSNYTNFPPPKSGITIYSDVEWILREQYDEFMLGTNSQATNFMYGLGSWSGSVYLTIDGDNTASNPFDIRQTWIVENREENKELNRWGLGIISAYPHAISRRYIFLWNTTTNQFEFTHPSMPSVPVDINRVNQVYYNTTSTVADGGNMFVPKDESLSPNGSMYFLDCDQNQTNNNRNQILAPNENIQEDWAGYKLVGDWATFNTDEIEPRGTCIKFESLMHNDGAVLVHYRPIIATSPLTYGDVRSFMLSDYWQNSEFWLKYYEFPNQLSRMGLHFYDSDGDGSPDFNNPQAGGAIDAFPDDPTEWADTDNDGVGDNADAFPSDPTEWADTDGDGRGDNSDVYPLDTLARRDYCMDICRTRRSSAYAD